MTLFAVFARRLPSRCRALGASVAMILAACGGPSAEADPSRVAVTLSEWKFSSSLTNFTTGKSYRFELRNTGSVEHEWAIVPRGAANERKVLTEVEEDELPPGATVVTDVTFADPGEYDFVCFVPGHDQAGMRLPITVTRGSS